MKHAKRLRRKSREAEEDPGRPSRAKRFNDPNSAFGKKSLVYRLKFGDLKDDAETTARATVQRDQAFHTRGAFSSMSPASRNATPVPHPRRDSVPASGPGLGGSRYERSFAPRLRERRFGRRDATEARNLPGPRESRPRPPQRRDAPSDETSHRSRNTYAMQHTRHNDTSEIKEEPTVLTARTKRKQDQLVSINYTTASSQFLYGTSVVKAAMTAGKRKLYTLYLAEGSKNEDGFLRRQAERLRIPIQTLPKGSQSQMDKMSMGRPHNGAVLEASPLPQPPLKSLGACDEGRLHYVLDWQSKEEEAVNGHETHWKVSGLRHGRKPLVVLLHEVVDPGNVGNILRTARFLGVSAVGMTRHASSSLTPTVLKAAAGASEELRLFTVSSPAEFIDASAAAGWVSFAACPTDGSKSTRQLSMKSIGTLDPLRQSPCLLLLGNEGQGLPTPLVRSCNYEVSIPARVARSTVDSLNVTVAAGLLCDAFLQVPTQISGGAAAEGQGLLTQRDGDGATQSEKVDLW